jgi:hypothetical protein
VIKIASCILGRKKIVLFFTVFTISAQKSIVGVLDSRRHGFLINFKDKASGGQAIVLFHELDYRIHPFFIIFFPPVGRSPASAAPPSVSR